MEEFKKNIAPPDHQQLTKKQRTLLKRQQKEKERVRYHHRKKLKKYVLVAAVVLIAGGIFSGVWFIGAGPPLPESEIVPNTSPGIDLPPSSFLPEVPRISAEEVKAKWDAGANIVIIDSRSKNSYDQSHIVGAISIQTMAEPYSDLDSYDEIIAYCSWPDEEESARAVQKLMKAGYSNAKAVEGGLPALKQAGLPVERTNQ